MGRKMGMPYFDLPLTWWGSGSGSVRVRVRLGEANPTLILTQARR